VGFVFFIVFSQRSLVWWAFPKEVSRWDLLSLFVSIWMWVPSHLRSTATGTMNPHFGECFSSFYAVAVLTFVV